MTTLAHRLPAVKPTRRTERRSEAPFAAGLFGHTASDELWWLVNCPVQSARVWQDGPYLFELVERPEISRKHPDRFTLSTWFGRELVERKGYGDERSALIAASVTADPLQFEDDELIIFDRGQPDDADVLVATGCVG